MKRLRTVGIICLMVCLVGLLLVVNLSAKEKPVRIRIGTAGVGHPLHIFGGAWATMVHKYGKGIEVTVLATGGSTEDSILIAHKDSEVGWVPRTVALYVQRSDPKGLKYMSKEELGRLRSLFSYFFGGMQFIVLEKSGIKSIYDLRDKKVVLGAVGSISEMCAKEFLNTHGLTTKDYKPYYLGSTARIDALINGTADCIHEMAPAPLPLVMEIAAKHRIRILSMDESLTDKLEKAILGFNRITLPKDVYSNMANTEDVVTMGSHSTVVAGTHVAEDTAYQMVKVLFEHLDELRTVVSLAKKIEPKNPMVAMKPLGIPLHPGAIKYYKEKGIEIPFELIPPESGGPEIKWLK